MWDDVLKKPAFEMEFKSQVLSVRLRRDVYDPACITFTETQNRCRACWTGSCLSISQPAS
jgi:hypothetical protein